MVNLSIFRIGISLIGISIICFLPVVCSWGINNSSVSVLLSHYSNALRDSMIVGVAMSIPELMNTVIEFDIKKSVSVFRVVILLAASTPIVLLLILNCNTTIIITLIHIRTLACVSLSLILLHILGDNFFRQKLFIIMAFCLTMATALCTWLSFSYVPKNIIATIYFTHFGVGSFLYFYITFNWLKTFSKAEIINLTVKQYLCSVYLIVSYLMCLGQLILVISCGPLSNNFSNVTYLTGNNILVSLSALIIWICYSISHGLEIRRVEVSLYSNN